VLGLLQISIVNGDKFVHKHDGAKCKSDEYAIDDDALLGRRDEGKTEGGEQGEQTHGTVGTIKSVRSLT
jgi:hypothetical protein